jgi:hypothetical protein
VSRCESFGCLEVGVDQLDIDAGEVPALGVGALEQALAFALGGGVAAGAA